MATRVAVSSLLALSISGLIATSAVAQDRKIEEIVITAEKQEATVSDTSISITAFTAETLSDFGIQSADEMINFIPATTRDEFDIRIRGVGRNFRALGGDPGVATYYNGVFSPDFGIASSEAGMYDLERVEALRGPQGTLYGRNAIGGAINYVTKKPTDEFEGEIRVQLGDFDTREVYGILSGPIIKDKLSARLVASSRKRDPWQEGLDGYDTDSTDDENIALALKWQVTDDIVINMRANDRESDRIIGTGLFITEGSSANRDVRSTSQAILGYRRVDEGTAGALAFTNPNTGEVRWGANLRAGIDSNGWPHQPNAAYQQDQLNAQINSKSDPNDVFAANGEGGDCDKFPSTQNSCNAEFFGHRAGHMEVTWDISEDLTLNYIFGHNDFDYTYNRDNDLSNADFSKYRETVLEDVQNHSHELQLHWSLGERWSATSGLYYSSEARDQNYSLSNTTKRFTEAANYGGLAGWVLWPEQDMPALGSVDEHRSVTALWDGDPRGDVFVQDNRVTSEAFAVYTQGTYVINDEFSLVLGVRWAKDKKTAVETRRSYFEATPVIDDYMDYLIAPTTAFGFACGPASTNVLECLSGSFYTDIDSGRTNLAMINVIMGRATWGADGSLVPNCDITDASCDTPLLLDGVPLSSNSRTSGSDDWSDVNYRVNLDWTPTEDILMYFSVTTGYRAGGYSLGVTDARIATTVDGFPGSTQLLSDPFSYDEETVLSTEIGYKGLHLDQTLQLNVSLYRYVYDNYQDRLNVYDDAQGRSVNIVQNANGAINQGFEIEALWFPTNELTLGGNYSFTDTEYSKDYYLALTNQPNVPLSVFAIDDPTDAQQVTDFIDLYVVNAKGDQLKRIPKHKYTLWGAYAWNTDVGSVTFRASYAYTGEMQTNQVSNDLDEIPDRFRLDTSVTWVSVDERWRARLFVDNATDERGLRSITTGTESANYAMSGTLLYPRYYGLDLSYKFGG